MNFTLQWLISTEDEGKSIKQFLKENEISKAALTDIKFKGGAITVNGTEENVRYILKNGNELKILFPVEQQSEGLIPKRIPLTIVYEDDYLLVINKPSGMSSIPSREHPTGSLANALLGYYQEKDIIATVHIVTRLDRDTSGLVLVAKHRHVHHLFSKAQKANKIKRTYVAFATGKIMPLEGTITEKIARSNDSIIKREVRADGKESITHYKVLEYADEFTYVMLRLETGRTHQIRVHLSFLGHPLLGDDLYGGSKDKIARQTLHCKELRFIHPITKEQHKYMISLSQDMLNLYEQKRNITDLS